jgi:outer membrane protein TolC
LPAPTPLSDDKDRASEANLPHEVGPEPAAMSGECTGPITLPEAIDLALRYQPRLRVYEERIEEARGRSDVAFAPFLPQVNLIQRAFAGENPNTDGFPLPLSEYSDAKGYQTYEVTEMYMQWTLWDFGRTYGRYRQAELGIDIARLQSERARQTTAYEVSAAYSRVLQAQAALRVGREAVRLAESVLAISRKSREAGLVPGDQVLRAEVQLAQARRSVVTAQKSLRVSVAALNQAIGFNVSTPTEVVDWTENPAFELTLAQCLERAVENRREFQVARQAIEAAAEGERAARADFLPRIYAEGVVAREEGRQTVNGASETGAINLSWSLFQGGRRLGELRSTNAAFRAASAQAQVVCDSIAFEVNEAYSDLDAARQDIVLARPAVAQARENLRLVTRRYETGDSTPTDIVDAETALTRSEQDLYTAQYDYLTALARIDYAMGTPPALAAGGY